MKFSQLYGIFFLPFLFAGYAATSRWVQLEAVQEGVESNFGTKDLAVTVDGTFQKRNYCTQIGSAERRFSGKRIVAYDFERERIRKSKKFLKKKQDREKEDEHRIEWENLHKELIRRKYVMLKNFIKSHPWGRLGLDSKACEFYTHNDPAFFHESNTPYSELWIGSHSEAPSLLKDTGEHLRKWIYDQTGFLGNLITKKYSQTLPVLMKILSAWNSSPLQVHPNKIVTDLEMSAARTKCRSLNPKIIIALSDFRLMCGFRPINEIVCFVGKVPEISILIGVQLTNKLKKAHKDNYQSALAWAFSVLMKVDKNKVINCIVELKRRLEKNEIKCRAEALVYDLIRQFPEDVVVFSPYFLNIIHLKDGEAMYIAPTEAHSYIFGDAIECSHTFDTNIYAGLTNEEVNIELFLSTLSYKSKTPPEMMLTGIKDAAYQTIFRVPEADFAVSVIAIPPKTTVIPLVPRPSASLLVVLEGEGKGNGFMPLRKGESFCLAQNFSLRILQFARGPSLLMFQLYINA